MLKSIHIQNYALIESLDIDFYSGFSVITGETGAGKSIILGAIGLLLGQRADIKTIRNGASKCVVEAHFNIASYELEPFFEEHDIEFDSEECILRRELYASGKSRAFINDTPASLTQMKDLGERLVDIHSQHQNLLLNKENFQMNVLDILAKDEKLLSEYKTTYRDYLELKHELAKLKESALKSRQDEDYIRFQCSQLEEAQLIDGEQELLEQEAEMLNHAEDIKTALYKTEQLMATDENGILMQIKECMNILRSLSNVYSVSNEWTNRLESCYIELKDLHHEVSVNQENVDFNPERLEFINERLNLIYSLQQKHHVSTLEELIQLNHSYQIKLNEITSFDERIDVLQTKIKQVYDTLIDKAAQLTRLRRHAADTMQAQMEDMLVPLGMPHARFQVAIEPRKEPDDKGMDSVSYLFSANKNGQLQHVTTVASGGEIARVMLSLKALIAGAVKLPTIVFDEIDTGVSGSIAEKMALIMQEMGRTDRQVISITHLPQIAARGSHHYKVYKEDTDAETISHIRLLSDKERINEIAHMLSGSNLTDAALNNAKALLNLK